MNNLIDTAVADTCIKAGYQPKRVAIQQVSIDGFPRGTIRFFVEDRDTNHWTFVCIKAPEEAVYVYQATKDITTEDLESVARERQQRLYQDTFVMLNANLEIIGTVPHFDGGPYFDNGKCWDSKNGAIRSIMSAVLEPTFGIASAGSW
jgi:hypothetical protein